MKQKTELKMAFGFASYKKRNLLLGITECETRLAIHQYYFFFFKPGAELVEQMWRDLCLGREKYSGSTQKGIFFFFFSVQDLVGCL